MDFLWHPATVLALHLSTTVAVGLRVVMVRPVPSVALAWLFLVLLFPGVGLLSYLAIGERRLGGRRAGRIAALRRPYLQRLRETLQRPSVTIDWTQLSDPCESMNELGVKLAGIPTLPGNEVQLLSDADAALRAIIADIELARSTLHLQFYIWDLRGLADAMVEAVVDAARRGVACRILVDALGSRDWLRSSQPERLRAAGAAVVAAMPTGPIRILFRRNDLRNHRKIVVVDGDIAYTGSMNAADPRFFRKEEAVGRYVDAMVRMRGPAVEALNGVLLSDWFIETQVSLDELIGGGHLRERPRQGSACVQVLGSGPGTSSDAILQMLLMMLYAARRRVIVTTPYFVPDDAMLRALRSAAARGVHVTVIVPAKVDSLLVRYASRSYYEDLMTAGVRIQHYHGGLLHTKSLVVDEQITMFGTANLDMRSLWLNFEVSLFVYDADFGARVHALQAEYLRDSTPIDPAAWRQRALPIRLVENLARLFSPLL